MKRRTLLAALGASVITPLAWRYWPEDGFTNECLGPALPEHISQHPLYIQATQGLDFSQVWDNHVHVVGLGQQDQRSWVNPAMQSWTHPIKRTQLMFYLDGSCVELKSTGMDRRYRQRLLELTSALPVGMKCMLLAFDYFHDQSGQAQQKQSMIYAANELVAEMARQHPQRFEWIASIHPYREDSVAQLELAAANGARAVKWLPQAMGIDPSSRRCHAFYDALHKSGIPLLCHVGGETAVSTAASEHFGNPLLLRHAMDRGVKVIAAHCASLGDAVDLDKGERGPRVSCFSLFRRIMEQREYDALLTGDISAMLQLNRLGEPIKHALVNESWHPRLINGSDYPLPGILPLFSLKQIKRHELINQSVAEFLSDVRRYNPLWFDFLLKRLVNWQGKTFSKKVFETRRHFTG